MTRTPARRLLVLALATALAPAFPRWRRRPIPSSLGGTPIADTASPAPPPEAFTVSDIRIDGLQRISAGTVFTYLPIERGDTDRPEPRGRGDPRAVQDRLLRGRAARPPGRHPGRHGRTSARRSTSSTLEGNKDIKTEDLQKGLKDIGLAEGETFDRHDLDQVTQELTRQYNNRGKYNVADRRRR